LAEPLGRAPGGDVRTVVVAGDRGHGRVLRQLAEHRGDYGVNAACHGDSLVPAFTVPGTAAQTANRQVATSFNATGWLWR
jgi:hypothetical protein